MGRTGHCTYFMYKHFGCEHKICRNESN